MDEQNYSNQYMNQQSFSGGSTSGPESSKPKGKGKIGYGRKVLIALSLGLFFGICAGLGFQAVDTAADYVTANIEKVQGVITWPEEEQDNLMEQEDNQESQAEIENTSSAATLVTDVTEVVRAVMPSVVSVSNNFVQEFSYFGQTMKNEGTSSGSGIIVGMNESELLLVSNYHVVSESQELNIQFVDGSQAQAQLKGMNEDMDLAVVAIPLSALSSETLDAIAIASLGDSDSLIVGEPAIAIGNALGYGQSVTTGVISALDRVIALSDASDAGVGDVTAAATFIQTDAAINPGNSGGALLNMKGEVIGINSNKIGGTTIEGMGYAIPISSAKPIIEELMQKETRLKVLADRQGYLGISGITVKDEYAEVYDMPRGVFVSQVFEETGASDAGLVRGDVIMGLNNEEISSMEELQNELQYYTAGDTVSLTIMQGSPGGYQSKQVSVVLGQKMTE